MQTLVINYSLKVCGLFIALCYIKT